MSKTKETSDFLKNEALQPDTIFASRIIRATISGRWLISIIATLVIGASFLAVSSLPNIYTATALVTPADRGSGGFSGLMRQYGGLASLAGVALPDGGDDVSRSKLGIELIKSRAFISGFVDRHKLLPDLFAMQNWDPISGNVTYDQEIYDSKTKQWRREVSAPLSAKPSSLEAHQKFQDALTVKEDKITGFITISISHKSPVVASNWVNLLVSDINDQVRKQEVLEATRSITFLQQKAQETPLTELRQVFYDLIQSQTEKVMLAQVRPEYVFKIVDPAVPPNYLVSRSGHS